VQEFFTAAERSGRPKGSGDLPESVTGNWSRTGFARPLAGLFTILSTIAFIARAFLVLQWVVSSKVQPFPEADGLWRSTWEGLWVVFLFFDMGTQTAFVKYFAEHRVNRPEEALKDVQFYVWWQIIIRLVQGTALCGIAIGWLPYSQYAIYAPFVALYSMVFLPALQGFGKFLTSALQRFDYQNLLDIAEMRVLLFFIPIPFVLVGRSWGAAHPIYGEAFGAAVGLGIGQLFTQITMVGLGLLVLKRMKLPLGPLFLAQFDRGVAKRQLWFGFKITLGQEPIKLITSIELVIITAYMSDFTAWQGIRDLLFGRLMMLFFFAWMFYMSGVPAFSEAIAAGKRVLAQYYVARFFQFGYLFSFTLFSLLCAVGPAFIVALGPGWARATPFLIPAMIHGLFLPPAWVSDALQQGSGRGWTYLIVIGTEQLARIVLIVLFVAKYGFWAIVIGTNGALATKALVAWTINHKTILPVRISWWSMLVALGIAGLVNFGIWKTIAILWAPTSEASTLVLLCLASAAAFVITLFVCGLAGGYDKAAQIELAQAARMTGGIIRPMARALAAVALRGAKLAPYTPKPLSLIEEAHAEAAAIDAAAAAALRASKLPDSPSLARAAAH
jgi:O-antigen/teichoic acid export membrane protein